MRFITRLRYLFRQRQMERELAEEIEFHRHMTGGDRAMGNIARAREDSREVWIWPWLQSVSQDLAYAVRNLRRAPGFTLIALLTLATAIGLNTSFFTVFNAVALRSWPVPDPSRVVKIFSIDPRRPNASGGGMGVAEYRYFAAHSRALGGFAVSYNDGVRFGFEPFGRSSSAALVGGDHFRVLGLQMHLGRGFLPEEDRLESPAAVVVLGYPYWRDHFGSDPYIVGKQVAVNEVSFTVVGVTPEDFTGTADGGGKEDVYLPLPAIQILRPEAAWTHTLLADPGACCVAAAGRLADGISRSQAAAELAVLDNQYRAEAGIGGRREFTLSGSSLLDNPMRRSQGYALLGLMFAGFSLVLLLACVNVGNLLIARAGVRQKEIEIRRAIGASSARLVRQLMTESLLLAIGAAALGLPIAYALPAFMIAQTGEVLALRLAPDGTVLAYTTAVAIFACIVFGLAPALHGVRANSRSRLRLRNLLLAVQVALSVVLLIGAGLAFEGVAHAQKRNPGFAIGEVSVVSFELPARSYDSAHAPAFNRNLAQDLEGKRFALTVREPLSNTENMADFRLSGEPETATRGILRQEVTGGYFEVLRIPILAGRNFTPADQPANVILVNQALARLYWGETSPLGQQVITGGKPNEVIGVVKDAFNDLDGVRPMLFIPFRGASIPKVLISPAEASAVTALAARLEPRARTQVLPLQANLDRRLKVARIGAEVAGMLGIYALILAVVGMSGVFAFVVQQRTKEIGIRMALGARPSRIVGLVLGGSSRAVLLGIAMGFPGAVLGSRLMHGMLYGVSPLDPVAYGSVVLLLTAAAVAASYIPARRASRVDPLQALRHD